MKTNPHTGPIMNPNIKMGVANTSEYCTGNYINVVNSIIRLDYSREKSASVYCWSKKRKSKKRKHTLTGSIIKMGVANASGLML